MCGLVVGDRVIDVGSEWRTFSNDKGILTYSTTEPFIEGVPKISRLGQISKYSSFKKYMSDQAVLLPK